MIKAVDKTTDCNRERQCFGEEHGFKRWAVCMEDALHFYSFSAFNSVEMDLREVVKGRRVFLAELQS